MNEPGGVASHAASLLPPIAAPAPGAVQPAWEPSNRRLSKKDSVRAGAFLIFYMAAYGAAGYAGVMFVEWAWMRIFAAGNLP
jgi:hypothetical protein